MLKRVNEILIGKNIARTAALAVTTAANIQLITTDIALGEILVLDKNMVVMDAAPTYAISETIYIVEGTDDTRFAVDYLGAETAMQRLILSAPIHGESVKGYTKTQYVAKEEEVLTIQPIVDTIVPGTEYILKLVHKDMVEHPGQYQRTYRYIAKAGETTSLAIFNGLRERISANKGRLAIGGGARITANAAGVANLVLTGKKIPQCTSSVNDIDELSQVNFEAFLNYVDNDGIWAGLNAPKVYVAAVVGSGSWEVIRDIEKHAQSYRGIENRTWFPILKPDMRTVKSEIYNTIVIEHDVNYKSADNQYVKSTGLTTEIALAGAGSMASQGLEIQTSLDAWMASLPTPLTDVTTLT